MQKNFQFLKRYKFFLLTWKLILDPFARSIRRSAILFLPYSGLYAEELKKGENSILDVSDRICPGVR